MDAEIKKAFLDYEGLKVQEKAIAEELKRLKEIILPHLPEDREFIGEYGKFTKRPGKVSWKFTPALTKELEEMEAKKKLEIGKGYAVPKYGEPFIVYTTTKE